MFGGLAVAALLVLAYPTYSDYSEIVSENEKLADQLKEKRKSAKKIKEQAEIAAAIAGWEDKGVNWLDELQSFSERFPSSRDAMVLRMTLSPSRGGRGTIAFNGLARDPTVVTQMELSLRDDRHEIQTPRVQEREQEQGYTWQFDSKIEITNPAKESQEKSKKTSKLSKSKDREESADDGDEKPDAKSSTAAQKSKVESKQKEQTKAVKKSKQPAGEEQ